MVQEIPQRHQLPDLPLIAKADRGNLGRKEHAGEEPRGAAVVQHGRHLAPQQQTLGRQVQAEFFVQLAQDAGLRGLIPFPPAAGQIPHAGPWDMGEIVAQIGQDPIVRHEGQLGAEKVPVSQSCTGRLVPKSAG